MKKSLIALFALLYVAIAAQSCATNADCGFYVPICKSNVCSACTSDADCGDNRYGKHFCQDTGKCTKSCQTSSDCPDLFQTSCDGGYCKPCKSWPSSTCPGGVTCSGWNELAFCQRCTDNSQCTDPITPQCAYGSCIYCLGDDACSGVPGKNRCLVQSKICVNCYQDSHCTSPQTCVNSQCVCSSSQDCQDPDLPVCSGSPKTCTASCSGPNDCSRFALTKVCDTTGKCVACTQDSDCTDPSTSKCSNKQCVACTDSTSCNRFALTKICDVNSDATKCVACTQDSHCTDPNASKCSSSQCVPCTDATNCGQFSLTKVCDTTNTNGKCVACTQDSHCTDPNASKCSNNQCVACTDSTTCNRFALTKVCDTTGDANNGKCVVCAQDSDCTDPNQSKCSGNQCVACTGPENCNHFTSTKACDTTGGTGAGKCVVCAEDRDCTDPAASICSSLNTCNVCSTYAGCTHISGKPSCTNTGCVACNADQYWSGSICTSCSSLNPKCIACSDANTCTKCSSGEPDGKECKSNSSSVLTSGDIVGIVIGTIVALAVVGWAIKITRKKSSANKENAGKTASKVNTPLEMPESPTTAQHLKTRGEEI